MGVVEAREERLVLCVRKGGETMDLRNALKHKAGTVVTVNGHDYTIGPDGVVREVAPEDAKKLLKNQAVWSVVGGNVVRAPVVVPPAAQKPASAAPAVPPATPPPPVAEAAAKPLEPATEAKEEEHSEEEYPDPDISMDVEYLREMAAAYEVKFDTRTSKATLVKRIMAAMYPDTKTE